MEEKIIGGEGENNQREGGLLLKGAGHSVTVQ